MLKRSDNNETKVIWNGDNDKKDSKKQDVKDIKDLIAETKDILSEDSGKPQVQNRSFFRRNRRRIIPVLIGLILTPFFGIWLIFIVLYFTIRYIIKISSLKLKEKRLKVEILQKQLEKE